MESKFSCLQNDYTLSAIRCHENPKLNNFISPTETGRPFETLEEYNPLAPDQASTSEIEGGGPFLEGGEVGRWPSSEKLLISFIHAIVVRLGRWRAA